jgi:hypothetical protein
MSWIRSTRVRVAEPRCIGPIIVIALVAGAWLSAATAMADCPMGTWIYDAIVEGSTVLVASEEASCPYVTMLRENVATGETVQLAPFCEFPDQGVYETYFADECVAPGSYRYGLDDDVPAENCTPAGYCDLIEVYAEVRVEGASDGGPCALSEGNPGVTSHPDPVPWDEVDGAFLPWCEDANEAGDGDASSSCSIATPGVATMLPTNGLAPVFVLMVFGVVRRLLGRS